MSTMDDIRVGLKVTVDEAQKQAVNQTEKVMNRFTSAVVGMTTTQTAALGAALGATAALGAAMFATVGAASRFEDSFAGIKKTVQASDVEFDKLAANIRRMAVDIPIATTQLNNIGEIGGQLGISAAGLTNFIDTIAKLGVATRLSTETAALGLARLREIFQLSENDFDNLASTLVDLGNNFAAMEDEILNTSLRLAAGGKLAGATAQDVLALSTALQAVGVQSQAGGTAISRVFQQIRVAQDTGGQALAVFEKIVPGFKEIAAQDPAQAFNAFIIGLKQYADGGGNVIQVLEDLGLKQQRTIRALLSLAEAGDLVTDTLVTANLAYEANIALNDEAAKRFETYKSQTKLLKNSFQELRIEMGMFFLPIAKSVVSTLTSLFKIMDSNSDSVKGFTTTLAGFTAAIAAVGGGLGVVLPAFLQLRYVARDTGEAVGKVYRNFDTLGQGLSVSKEQLGQSIAVMRKFRIALASISAGLLAVSLIYASYKKRQQELQAVTERFIQVTNISANLTEKLTEKTEELNRARESGASESYIKALEAEKEKTEEILGLLERTQVQTFFKTASIKLSDESADEIIGSYQDIFNEIGKMQGAQGVDFNFNEAIAESLGISEEDAVALYEKGIGAFLQAVAAGEAAGLNSMQKIANLLTQLRKNAASADGVFDTKLQKAYEDELEVLKEYEPVIRQIQRALGASKMTEDQQKATLQGLVDKYNEVNKEVLGYSKITVDDLIPGTELFNNVLETNIESLTGSEDAIRDNKVAMQELASSFVEATDSASDFIQEISNIEKIDVMSGAGIVANFDKMNDRMVAGNMLMAEMVSRGFPAIAKQAQQMNAGERIAFLTAQLSNSNVALQEMEDHLTTNVKGYEEFQTISNEGLQTIIDTLTGGIDESAASEALKNVYTDVTLSNRAEELEILQELLRIQDSNAAAQEKIAEATTELNRLTENLVYQGITLSQIEIRRLESKEAQLAFEEAIAQYGAEGVVTSNEQLELLQMTLNLDRMRDKLSQQMTAREAKRIRDKEKEVKFLELAVEQGVVDQLDLDAAREELEDLRNPLSDTERQILELQKEIAEAQKAAYESRMEALAPEVVSAMQNVIDKERDLANFANQVSEAQRKVAEAYTASTITKEQNKQKLRELMTMYPNLQGMIKELADSIGIPAEITQAVLVEMEKNDALYRSELDGMSDYYDDFIKEISTKPIVFTADATQVEGVLQGIYQNIVNGIKIFSDPYQPTPPAYGQYNNISSGIKMFADPYQQAAEARSRAILQQFGNPDEYFGRYSGGMIPVGRYSTVGEAGPEKVMSLRGGGAMVFPNKTGGGGNGITVDNMNINITGLPADPITARKVALNIRKELVKLEKEGNAGTGLLNR